MTIDQFNELFGRITSHGWLTLDEAMLLVSAAEGTRGPMVEVGSYMGRSAMLLGQLMEEYAEPCQSGQRWLKRVRPLYCVDPWDDHFSSDMPGQDIYTRFLENIHSLPNGGANITPVRCKVEDWQAIPAGFVYLDGDHTYKGTLAQIHKAKQCLPEVIAIHDVNDGGQGNEVKRAAVLMLGPWYKRQGALAIWKR